MTAAAGNISALASSSAPALVRKDVWRRKHTWLSRGMAGRDCPYVSAPLSSNDSDDDGAAAAADDDDDDDDDVM